MNEQMVKIQIQYRHFFGYDLLNFFAGLLTLFPYTHAELLIQRNGIIKSYSSTFKKGVRKLTYDRTKLEHGKWKIYDLYVSHHIADEIENWFKNNAGKGYDYRALPFLTWFGWLATQISIFRFFRKDSRGKYYCIESIMAALYFAFDIKNNPAVSVKKSMQIVDKYSEVLNKKLFVNTINIDKKFVYLNKDFS